MLSGRKHQIWKLLKGIETGDTSGVSVISTEQYIQHNPETHEGSEGLAILFERLSKTNPRVNLPRVFEDGDFVFAHTEYDFASSNIGFEIFRFEDGLAVEHWDNIQERQGPNPSGHSMVDGPTEATDLDRTETNRERVRSFVDDVLIHRRLDRLADYVCEDYVEHNPGLSDGLLCLRSALTATEADGNPVIAYHTNHRLLAEGSFVLSVSEGSLDGVHSSFFDLFRLAGGLIVEHWDTTEPVPPKGEWKNDNGKF